MSYFTSAYRFNGGGPEDRLGSAVIISAAFHLLAAGLVIFILPNLFIKNDKTEKIIIDAWIIPGDIRTSAFDESLVDPDKSSRDEGRVNNNTDPPEPRPEPVMAEELKVAVDDYIIPINKESQETRKDPIKTSSRPDAIILPPIDRPEPASAIKPGAGEAGGGGMGGSEGTRVLPPEMAAYYGRVRGIISRNWTRPSETMASDITAVYAVTIEPDGQMSRVELLSSSGNELYDASVMRALGRSIYLPELPPAFGGRPIKVGLQFRLSDMLMAAPRVKIPAADELPANGFF